MNKQIRILFICHGNICRSPMAEFIMKHLVEQRGIADQFVIASAATSTEELGNDMYPPAKRCLTAHDVPFARRRARQVFASDAQDFDLLICMDNNNIRNLGYLLSADAMTRVHKLMEYAPSSAQPAPAFSRDVADPWYTNDYETTYCDILEGCEGLLFSLGFKG